MVKKKNCAEEFQCISCRYDRIMSRVARENQSRRNEGLPPFPGKRGEIVHWKNKLLTYPPSLRPCIHHIREAIDFKACYHDYRCDSCEFDQYFQDQFTVHAVVTPIRAARIEGFTFPAGYYLSPNHLWVKVEGGSEVRMGISDFALRLMGPLTSVEGPLMGKIVKKGQPVITARRDMNKAVFFSPVTGIVTNSNHKLVDNGSNANKSPYSEGWVIRVMTSNLRHELKSMMLGEEAEEYIRKDVNRLYGVIEETIGLAADGGELGHDIYGALPKESWSMIMNDFFGKTV